MHLKPPDPHLCSTLSVVIWHVAVVSPKDLKQCTDFDEAPHDCEPDHGTNRVASFFIGVTAIRT
jgi:hypothetical protein